MHLFIIFCCMIRELMKVKICCMISFKLPKIWREGVHPMGVRIDFITLCMSMLSGKSKPCVTIGVAR